MTAQLKAYGYKQSDNSCKVIYLVNPTDSIYYVAGLKQNELSDCQTFNSKLQSHTDKLRINVSNNEDEYLLLLPKDTIAYNVLISREFEQKEKELSVFIRNEPDEHATDKRSNKPSRKQIYKSLVG